MSTVVALPTNPSALTVGASTELFLIAAANAEIPAQEAGERPSLFQPSAEAIAEVTSLLAPGDSRR
ncbi:hypothetical protein MOQ72_40670 [Saccharopolyspora sp. K220]|uniref:hypothetical protein n=1 Tax=Saccharopolyspora soli TaxID=2926618 RepID=UPI001F5657BA|nr:hypothetical protein [Saccharopolyspora soli]MCI2423739.1 hypothetical protein [Saccharopolyspora soli]